MANHSKVEQHHLYNSLTGLVKSLENQHTVVDLRNESTVTGLISKVDGYMNVEMKNAVFYDQHGREHKFRDFYISARNIRNVHIPKDLPIQGLLEAQLSSLNLSEQKKTARKGTKQRNKQVKARQYNERTIQSAFQPQPGPSHS